jgi:DNA ligase (NAD+)
MNVQDKIRDKVIRHLKKYDNEYHTKGKATISDTEYDKMKTEAKKIWPDHEYFKTVGAPVSSDKASTKVRLPYVLGSLDKMKIDTVQAWLAKYDGPFQASEKVDGMSFYVEYNGGEVIRGATRGDGTTGQDITNKLKLICPEIPLAGNIVFRGELVLKKTIDFTDINNKRIKNGKKPYKNRRGVVIGIINSDDFDLVHLISPVFYEVIAEDGEAISANDASVIFSQSGLPLVKSIVSGIFKPEGLVELLAEWKADAEYDMDGLVLSVYDAIRENVMLPESRVAFKVNEDAVAVRVTGVEWTTSRNGRVIPVVLLEPTDIEGSTISRTTGFNAQFIFIEGIDTGAVIGLVKSGSVIPYLTEVITPSNRCELPKDCPSCGEKVEMQGVHLVCTNPRCFSANLFQVEHFLKTLEIENMSATSLAKLNVLSIKDLYDLTEDKIMEVEGFGYKRASEIIDQINKSLTTKPYKLLAAFGIPLIGRTASKAITSRYSFDKLFDLNKSNDLGLGPTISQSFFDHIAEFKEVYEYLLDKGLTFSKEKKSMISGKVFAMTGADPGGMGRKELTEMIEDRGGSVKSVSKDTDFLICASEDKGSSKTVKAQKLGVKIISYPDLMKMLED